MDKLAKKKRALEFLTVFTAVVGTIIGVGIYVKNDNLPGHVLGNVQNPIIATIL
jgi:APA family basic amino acid/polyamine antiporter